MNALLLFYLLGYTCGVSLLSSPPDDATPRSMLLVTLATLVQLLAIFTVLDQKNK